jgi:Na+/H+-dicarboxylate symporter
MTLATKVLIGFALGVGSGIFFGELAAPVGVVGDAFIRLLQMTVLPYVVVSLIHGLGQLSYQEAKLLARRAGLLLLVIWAVALTFVLMMPLAYPAWESASQFSTSLVEPTPEMSLVELFIPANPFHSLAFGMVPAVVVFSLALGAALMGIANKQPILDGLGVVAKTLSRVAQFVVRLAPIGVFAITARAAGTIEVQQFEALEVYLATYLVFWFAMAWFLPALTSALTPLSFRETMGPARDAFVTAFATGSVFVVLPLLAEHSKNLVRRCAPDSEDAPGAVDVLIPLAFTFPGPGTLFILGFVQFSAWTAGGALALDQLPAFLSAGVMTLFGSTMVAVPFMLDLLHIPADLFQLYVVSDVFTGRFGMLLAAIFVLLWSTLGACAMAGALTVRWRELGRLAVVTVALVGVGLFGVNAFFSRVVSHEYTGGEKFAEMDLITPLAQVTVLDADDLEPTPGDFDSALDRIQSRGAVRVGCREDALPFSYRKRDGELVGHDIDLAHTLARDLGVRLELVPVTRKRMSGLLASGAIDIVMAGVALTLQRAQQMGFSAPYMDDTLAFLAPDHRRNEFTSSESVRALTDLTVGVPDLPGFVERVERSFPNAKFVVVASPREFFEQPNDTIDVMVFSAERGSAWTLAYPQYSVVVPQPDVVRVPVAFPMRAGDERLREFVNHWIEIRRRNGTLDRLYDHWILGRSPEADSRRWSVIRDVLHWVD